MSFPLLTLLLLSSPAQAKINCANLSQQLPVPSNPRHVKNSRWRNQRAHCRYVQFIEQQKFATKKANQRLKEALKKAKILVN